MTHEISIDFIRLINFEIDESNPLLSPISEEIKKMNKIIQNLKIGDTFQIYKYNKSSLSSEGEFLNLEANVIILHLHSILTHICFCITFDEVFNIVITEEKNMELTEDILKIV